MIHIHSLAFQYGHEGLFKDLSLTLTKGNIYGLLGLNGAGKTTLLKLVSGQLFAEGGQIDSMGHDPARRDAEFLQKVSYVPEEFAVPPIQGSRYIDLYARFYPHFSIDLMKRYCEELQIDSSQMLTKMSYGQKKKFFLAFALASNTELVILDEPTNGLDIPSKSQFRRTVSSAMSDERTVIISTHQVRDMEHLIDPLVIIHNQKIVMNATLEDIDQNLCARFTSTPPVEGDPLYTENTGLGYRSLYRSDEGIESEGIDIEFLFNAVISRPEAFITLGGTQ